MLSPPQPSLHHHRQPYTPLWLTITHPYHTHHPHPILLLSHTAPSIPHPVPLQDLPQHLHLKLIPYIFLLFHPYLSLFHPLLRSTFPLPRPSLLPLPPTQQPPHPHPPRQL
ncbi:hypothetical protein Pmani_017335 [Petrolisthes manimaculis]|uniref:Uncharacterized protein n=1 Tax=Petrolisthes manimaculis TaxID=1843537 RepID=A0AAE1U5J6_9EUCA|nr:hypothetical protein Pmani_017335 [Petrolisthes manimaculis]